MKNLAAVAFLALLVGCGTPPPVPTGAQAPSAGAEPSREIAEKLIRERLQRLLKDPDSMKQFAITRGPFFKLYRQTNFSNWQAAWVVCYELNSKNSYGGYVGVKPHAVMMEGAPYGPIITRDIAELEYAYFCQQ